MELATILGLIQAANTLTSTILPLVSQVKEALSSDDEATLTTALATMEAQTEKLHAATQALLRGQA